MAFYDVLTPTRLKALTNQKLAELIDQEAARARPSLEDLQQRYPSAGPRELAQRFIDSRKQMAGVLGGVTGVFGAVTVPLDLVGMVYLQLALMVEVGTVFKADVRSDRGKKELLDLFGYANGIGPLQRISPKVLGSLARLVLTRSGLAAVGRAMPLVAAPISAYLNNQHVQRVGDSAIRHFDGWVHAHEKQKRASGGP